MSPAARCSLHRRFALVALLVWLAAAVTGQGAPLRLAVLAVDAEPGTAALADLLTAGLSGAGGVELVERAEIDKVLAEQKLSAATLAGGAQRVAVGKLLRADGLVFVEQDRRRESVSVRLVETRQGFQVVHDLFARKKREPATLAPAVRDAIVRTLPKLRLDPADRVLVSVIRIGDATLSPGYSWIEDDLPQLVGSYLSREPRILLLERRELGHLLGEAELTATDPAFRASAVFLDGEVYRRPGEEENPQDPAVSFVLRLRDAQLATLATVTEHGKLSGLEQLTVAVVGAARRKLQELKPQVIGAPAEESRFWLELARQRGLRWAAESAHALDAKD
ncbi:hypothetical protein HQ590_03400, partial [bacterium]|nr:hypothetical protein [bacterium]